MNSAAPGLLLIATFLGTLAQAQDASPADPHAGHVMPTAPAVDHSQHQMPTVPAIDHSQHQMPATTQAAPDSTLPAGVRDPHAYANGYVVGSGAYALPGGHAGHMSSHVYSGAFVLDRLETVDSTEGRATHFAIDAWYGRDFRRWWLLSEGEHTSGESLEASTELLASRAVSNYWDAVAGVQLDTGDSTRSWLSVGVRGLAPYWFEVDARLLLGESGQSALTLESEYDLRLTQKLILQPMAELTFNGRSMAQHGEGRGLADVHMGLRLRHEFTPQFAPYVGVEHSRQFGDTARFHRQQGEPTRDTRLVLGLRLWF
jgi:copper resistance protein B